MRVLVCGGRDYTDFDAMGEKIHDLFHGVGIDCLIHGGARGADKMAGKFADIMGIPVEVYDANWEQDGKVAGPIRNSRMLKEGKPDLVVAFRGGRGTADMTAKARKAGVRVIDMAPTRQPKGGE